MFICPTKGIYEGEKKSTVAGYANTHTHTVAGSDCGSVGKTDHKDDASTRPVVEHTYVKAQRIFYRKVDTPALDAVESAGELDQRSTPHYGDIACEYAGSRIMDATIGGEVTWTDVLLAPLLKMEELVQLKQVSHFR
ncbi:hypothetical protein Plhal304r1_c081g0166661 [Plasmopara halstedii]